MTRRWPDISKPRGETGTSAAIGAGFGMLAGVIVLLIVGMILALLFSVTKPARARDSGQWQDGAISQWFKTLMQPDKPYALVPCCGKADAYWADKVETGPNGELIAIITDDRDDVPLGRHHVPVGTRIPVPGHKIKWDQGNPTGHIVIFLTPANEVYCYVQNGGV